MYPKRLEKICCLLDLKYRQIVEEKQQSQQLLFQMLPISVAKKLIDGKTVAAETFDRVTIYFSDIVGFNDAALSASPIQIVNLLNSIYGYVSTSYLKYCKGALFPGYPGSPSILDRLLS